MQVKEVEAVHDLPCVANYFRHGGAEHTLGLVYATYGGGTVLLNLTCHP